MAKWYQKRLGPLAIQGLHNDKKGTVKSSKILPNIGITSIHSILPAFINKLRTNLNTAVHQMRMKA